MKSFVCGIHDAMVYEMCSSWHFLRCVSAQPACCLSPRPNIHVKHLISFNHPLVAVPKKSQNPNELWMERKGILTPRPAVPYSPRCYVFQRLTFWRCEFDCGTDFFFGCGLKQVVPSKHQATMACPHPIPTSRLPEGPMPTIMHQAVL